MENEKNFPEIYKGRADLSKYGFSSEQISEIDKISNILNPFYNKEGSPEDEQYFRGFVSEFEGFVLGKIEEKHEIDYYEGFFYEYTDEAKRQIKEFFDSEEQVWDKIRKNEEVDPERSKIITEFLLKVSTGK